MKSFAVLSLLVVLSFSVPLHAEIGWREGAVAHKTLPPTAITKTYVRLNIPHLRQDDWMCVPTSAAMVISYFGETANPRQLKEIAENHKPEGKRNSSFTYWSDMKFALKKIGYRWKIRDYPRNKIGFDKGLRDMKRHLRNGLPVLIDVHQDEGHTFVVMGFDDIAKVVYVRDPNLPKQQSRVFSYSVLQENWHNHRFGPTRSAFFPFPKS
jgi:hypothetical protein